MKYKYTYIYLAAYCHVRIQFAPFKVILMIHMSHAALKYAAVLNSTEYIITCTYVHTLCIQHLWDRYVAKALRG